MFSRVNNLARLQRLAEFSDGAVAIAERACVIVNQRCASRLSVAMDEIAFGLIKDGRLHLNADTLACDVLLNIAGADGRTRPAALIQFQKVPPFNLIWMSMHVAGDEGTAIDGRHFLPGEKLSKLMLKKIVRALRSPAGERMMVNVPSEPVRTAENSFRARFAKFAAVHNRI